MFPVQSAAFKFSEVQSFPHFWIKIEINLNLKNYNCRNKAKSKTWNRRWVETNKMSWDKRWNGFLPPHPSPPPAVWLALQLTWIHSQRTTPNWVIWEPGLRVWRSRRKNTQKEKCAGWVLESLLGESTSTGWDTVTIFCLSQQETDQGGTV